MNATELPSPVDQFLHDDPPPAGDQQPLEQAGPQVFTVYLPGAIDGETFPVQFRVIGGEIVSELDNHPDGVFVKPMELAFAVHEEAQRNTSLREAMIHSGAKMAVV